MQVPLDSDLEWASANGGSLEVAGLIGNIEAKAWAQHSLRARYLSELPMELLFTFTFHIYEELFDQNGSKSVKLRSTPDTDSSLIV